MRLLYTALIFLLLSGCIKDDPLNKPFQSFVPEEINDGLILSSPEDEGMDQAKLTQVYQGIYTDENLWPLRSLLVFRNGHLVAESYLKDDSYLSQPQMIWSCTKQVVGILSGIALEEGIISSLDDPLHKYLPDMEQEYPEKANISIRQLLTMHSGIDYNNDGVGGQTDKVLRQIPDKLTPYVLSLPMREDPGSSFWYNDGDPQLVASLIQETTGKAADLWANDVFFSKIGLSNYNWVRYKDGTTLGGYGIETTPRGMGKIALCVADSGRYSNQQVIPSDWISQMTSLQVTTGYDFDFGYFWWLDLQRGIHFMWGHGGQFAFIVPAESLVVVMTSIPNTQGDYQIQADEALLVVDQIVAACTNAVSK
jgi:CubicO group peptidase (beta-lactamase class C family)